MLFMASLGLMFTSYHLHDNITANSFIAITTGWALVCIIALDMLKVEFKRRLAKRKVNATDKTDFKSTQRPIRQRLVQSDQIQLSSGHIVSLSNNKEN